MTTTTSIPTRGALRPNEVADWLGCSRDTVDRLISRGELKSFKLGASRFISSAELDRFIRENEAAY
jgi:excisionase family DNA binding protein